MEATEAFENVLLESKAPISAELFNRSRELGLIWR